MSNYVGRISKVLDMHTGNKNVLI